MTLQEAKSYIEHPVFGDQSCIDAIKLLQLAERVESAREWSCYNEWIDYDEYRETEAMTEEELALELSMWCEVGYEEVEAAA